MTSEKKKNIQLDNYIKHDPKWNNSNFYSFGDKIGWFMAHSFRWQLIAEELRADINEGRYAPGHKLDTEEVLARRFHVNRHTVRRAIELLKNDGLVHSRRGSGVYVHRPVTPYRLGSRTRFRENLARVGVAASAKVLRVEVVAASQEIAAMLHITQAEEVILFEAIGLADDTPLSLRESYMPAAKMADVKHILWEQGSITAAMEASGHGTYRRLSTRITAGHASLIQADHLQCARGDALLITHACNVTQTGEVVEFCRSHFVGSRVFLDVNQET